ncbi:MAG: hypothetical protein ACW98Y_12910 [Candidatus Thorarchaeota archaeon]
MSSIHDTYKVLVAGDEESGYTLCTRLIDKELPDPRTLAVESLSKDWPDDEWIKFVTLSSGGTMTTMELDLELHGPWIWELYNVMEPRDYFRRFAAAIITADPKKPDAMTHIPTLIESIDTHIGHRIPMIVLLDTSPKISRARIKSVRDMAKQLEIPFVKTEVETGVDLDDIIKDLAVRIAESLQRKGM